MDTWQSWVTIVVGIVASGIVWDRRQEKTDNRALTAQVQDLSDRVTRVEAEVVTEREVREVLHELIQPFSATMAKIEAKQDLMADNVTEIKISLGVANKKAE